MGSCEVICGNNVGVFPKTLVNLEKAVHFRRKLGKGSKANISGKIMKGRRVGGRREPGQHRGVLEIKNGA